MHKQYPRKENPLEVHWRIENYLSNMAQEICIGFQLQELSQIVYSNNPWRAISESRCLVSQLTWTIQNNCLCYSVYNIMQRTWLKKLSLHKQFRVAATILLLNNSIPIGCKRTCMCTTYFDFKYFTDFAWNLRIWLFCPLELQGPFKVWHVPRGIS